ncbi:unnamed protein product [Phytophthora lilii]|uniref:Unnamed protein product n=1 Tax=Phytophthora lilii TaxID=2077276 RepID=A0A9W6TWL1_9STRA|nr:unnamed protein product [Phytophthora lilii]
MIDGLIPVGLQSPDTPAVLYDVEFRATNLRSIPDDLDTKWLTGGLLGIEYSQLKTVPDVLIRMFPYCLSLAGNPINDLPAELFEIEGITALSLGFTAIRELPQNVTRLSSTLATVYIPWTDVSFFLVMA